MAIERVQMETAQRWFGVLEEVPPIATAVRGVHRVHAVCVSSTHGVIRGVTRLVGGTVTVVLHVVDEAAPARGGGGVAPGSVDEKAAPE